MATVVDSTLREGIQTAGVYLDLGRQVEIVAGLGAAGVGEIEVGPATAPGDVLARLVARVRRDQPSMRVGVWCRALAPDIEAACALEPDVVAFCLPVSDLHLRVRLGHSPRWAVRQIASMVEYARHRGAPRVSVGLEDATRADPAVVERVVRAAVAAGVDRVRLADTVGIATPAAIAALVGRCRPLVPGTLAVHTHDDFGMATANAIAALDAGADTADVSLLGLGERAGIARTEEVCAFLALSRGAAFRVPELRALCHRVADWVGRTVPGESPVIGERVFDCESGLHVDGLVKDPRCYQPFSPALAGAVQRIRLGGKAGRNAVAAVVARLGEQLAPEQLGGLTVRIRALADHLGRPLTDAEVRALLREQRVAG